MEQKQYIGEYTGEVRVVRRTWKDLKFEKNDMWLAAGVLVCGVLFCNWIFDQMIKAGDIGLGAGVTAFTAVILTVCLLYFRSVGIRQTKRSGVALVVVILAAVPFSLLDNGAIELLNLMFLVGAFVYWVCLSTGKNLEERLSALILGDVINQGIWMPFSNFFCGGYVFKKRATGSAFGKNLLYAALGIIIILPVTILILTLLVRADSAFEFLVGRLLERLSFGNAGHYIWNLILGIPVALYLFGLIYGDTRGGLWEEGITAKGMRQVEKNLRIAPAVMVYTALVLFNLIYLIFIGAQAGYFFSAFSNVLPEAMTYAEYARRGFFELCNIAFINLCILIAANLFLKRKEDGLRSRTAKILTALLALLTILMIITALSKMVMYINCYGLTPLRIYPSIFMIFLLVLFAAILIRQFAAFNVGTVTGIALVAAVLITLYGNVDGVIAKYNIERYEAGTLEELDVYSFWELDDGAVEPAAALYQRIENQAVKAELGAYLDSVKVRVATRTSLVQDFPGWDLQSQGVLELLAEFDKNITQ